jgi:hypothetical protein
MPSPVFTGWSNSGQPIAAGRLYIYLSGTLTPATAYTDVALTTPHANPIILDAGGRAVLYLAAGSYKFVLKTSADVEVWTSDPVQATHTNQTLLGDVFVFGGDSTSPITATSYPAGATFDTCHAGTSWISLDSGNLPSGTYVLEGMLLSVAGDAVTAGLVNLSDGSPDTALVEITSTSLTGGRARSGAITFPASGAAKTLAVKVKTAAGSGYAWGLRLLRTA